jgi:hypothetical protein
LIVRGAKDVESEFVANRLLAFCEIHVARGTVGSSATSAGAIEFGKIPIIVFCSGRAMKGIPLGITTQALLKNISRPVCFDGSIESL